MRKKESKKACFQYYHLFPQYFGNLPLNLLIKGRVIVEICWFHGFLVVHVSKCRLFILDQSMYCPFNPLAHNPVFWRHWKGRLLAKHGKWIKCCDFCTFKYQLSNVCWTDPCVFPLTLNHEFRVFCDMEEGFGKTFWGKEKKLFCIFMKLDVKCLYWTSPCIVPLTFYHII